ncbi:MAG: hypothetical protein HY261_05230 [Chloroflexi bacterium]|nr:hypothetical protein [Chloroflexota bacterium]
MGHTSRYDEASLRPQRDCLARQAKVITDTGEELVLADPDTPLGMLQRGRGEGYLWALSAQPSELHTLLIDVLTHDPRSNGQLEWGHGRYYASLLIKTSLDVSPVQEFFNSLRQEHIRDWEAGRLAQLTLAQAAARGHQMSLRILLEQVKAGPCWAGALRRPPVPEINDMMTADDLLVCASNHDVVDLLEAKRDDETRTALLNATLSDVPDTAWTAFLVLKRWRDTGAFDQGVAALHRKPRIRTGAEYYLASLPAELTLPFARAWFPGEEPLKGAAGQILKAHAEARDIPMVLEALRAGQEAGNHHLQIDPLDIIERLPQMGPYPELMSSYLGLECSLCRSRAVDAMIATSPALFESIALACLFDCDEAVVRAATEHAPLSIPGVRQRLMELASDTFADDQVREAAAKRLTE